MYRFQPIPAADMNRFQPPTSRRRHPSDGQAGGSGGAPPNAAGGGAEPPAAHPVGVPTAATSGRPPADKLDSFGAGGHSGSTHDGVLSLDAHLLGQIPSPMDKLVYVVVQYFKERGFATHNDVGMTFWQDIAPHLRVEKDRNNQYFNRLWTLAVVREGQTRASFPPRDFPKTSIACICPADSTRVPEGLQFQRTGLFNGSIACRYYSQQNGKRIFFRDKRAAPAAAGAAAAAVSAPAAVSNSPAISRPAVEAIVLDGPGAVPPPAAATSAAAAAPAAAAAAAAEMANDEDIPEGFDLPDFDDMPLPAAAAAAALVLASASGGEADPAAEAAAAAAAAAGRRPDGEGPRTAAAEAAAAAAAAAAAEAATAAEAAAAAAAAGATVENRGDNAGEAVGAVCSACDCRSDEASLRARLQ